MSTSSFPNLLNCRRRFDADSVCGHFSFNRFGHSSCRSAEKRAAEEAATLQEVQASRDRLDRKKRLAAQVGLLWPLLERKARGRQSKNDQWYHAVLTMFKSAMASEVADDEEIPSFWKSALEFGIRADEPPPRDWNLKESVDTYIFRKLEQPTAPRVAKPKAATQYKLYGKFQQETYFELERSLALWHG